MRSRVSALPLLALMLMLAPRATAQTPGQVLSDFKKQAKVAIKDCKAALKQAADDLQTDIDIFELSSEDLASSDAPLETFVGKLIDYQSAAHLAVVQGSDGIGTLAGLALAALTPGGADEDVYPKGLLSGDGGALDDLLAQITQASIKANASVAKKLVKLSKKLRAKTDMRLTLVLPPQPALFVAPMSGSYEGSNPVSLMIDLLVGFNRGGEDDDGHIWVSGFADQVGGDVSIIVHGPTNDNGTTGVSFDDGRWSFGTISTLKEGSYFVVALQSGGAFVDRVIRLP